MFPRLLNPIATRSFFIFGARGVGKTCWLQKYFKNKKCLWIDLLDEDNFERYSLAPQLLDSELKQLEDEKKLPEFVVIDEVQRVPRLLNVAQKWIQKKKLLFVLTGSSARKLRRGSANLLGGRANSYGLFTLSIKELGKHFDLESALEWGSLPEIIDMKTEREKSSYLKAYCSDYLKEEILIEQLVRNLPPFRKFLSILAQNQGKLINFEKFSRDIGVDSKTIQSYIEILEDTYLGLLLRPHHPSIRKSQLQSPKFYFFDNGVQRQLSGMILSKPVKSTSYYGELFEAFIIQEINRVNHYRELGYNLSFYSSKNGFEIDLILSRANQKIFIEIKSTSKVDLTEVKALDSALEDIENIRIVYLSQDTKSLKVGRVECQNYKTFIAGLV